MGRVAEAVRGGGGAGGGFIMNHIMLLICAFIFYFLLNKWRVAELCLCCRRCQVY